MRQPSFAFVALPVVIGLAILLSSLGVPDRAAAALGLFLTGCVSLLIGRLTGLILAFAGGLALMLFGVVLAAITPRPWVGHSWVPAIVICGLMVLVAAGGAVSAWSARRTHAADGCLPLIVAVLVVLVAPSLVAATIPVDPTWYDFPLDMGATVTVGLFLFLMQIRGRSRAGRRRRWTVGLPAIVVMTASAGLFLAALLAVGGLSASLPWWLLLVAPLTGLTAFVVAAGWGAWTDDDEPAATVP